MENIKLVSIKKKQGGEIPLFSSEPNFRAVSSMDYIGVLNGEDSLSVSIESSNFIEINIGDYIILDGKKFSINTPIPEAVKNARNRFEYNLKFEGEAYILQKCYFFDTDVNGVFTSVFFTAIGDLEFWGNLIVNNVHRAYPNFFTNIITLEGTDEKQLTFSKNNCLESLQAIIKEFDVDYKVVERENGERDLVLSRFGDEIPYSFEYGYSKGLYSISRVAVDSSNVITRLYVTGSNKNLPTNYRSFSPYLKMTNGDDYLQDNDIVDAFGIIEGYEQFEEIFPSRSATITGLNSNFLEITDSSMNFDLNSYLANGVTAKINMLSGNLSGYTFDITNYNNSTKTFRVKQFKDSAGTLYPNQSEQYLQFSIGDKYTLIDILPPQEYIVEAEAKLKSRAIDFYNKVKRPKVKYQLNLDSILVQNMLYAVDSRFDLFRFGDLLKVVDSDFGLNDFIRILQVKIDILNSAISLELAEYTYKTISERVISATKQLERIVQTNTKLLSPTEQKQYWQQSTSDILDWSPFEKLEKGLFSNKSSFIEFNKDGARLVLSPDNNNSSIDGEEPLPTVGLIYAENHRELTSIDPNDTLNALNLSAFFSAKNATLQNIGLIARAYPHTRQDISKLPDLGILADVGDQYFNNSITKGRVTIEHTMESNYEGFASAFCDYIIITPIYNNSKLEVSRMIKKSGGDLHIFNNSDFTLILKSTVLNVDEYELKPYEVIKLFMPVDSYSVQDARYIVSSVGSSNGLNIDPFKHFEFGLYSEEKAILQMTESNSKVVLSSDGLDKLGNSLDGLIYSKSNGNYSNRASYFEASEGQQDNRAITAKASPPSETSTTPDYIGGKKGLAISVLEGASVLKELSFSSLLGVKIELTNSLNTISVGNENYIELVPNSANKEVIIQSASKSSGGGILFYNSSQYSLGIRHVENGATKSFQLEPSSYVELVVDSLGVSHIKSFFGNSAKMPMQGAFLGGLSNINVSGSEFLEILNSSSNPSFPTRIKIQTSGQGLGKELFIYNASSNSISIEDTISGNANFTLVSGSYLKIKKVSTGWIQL